MFVADVLSRCAVDVDNTYFSEYEAQLVRKAGRPHSPNSDVSYYNTT
jgi:predicted urease superfamily metal-dependent hydrolase